MTATAVLPTVEEWGSQPAPVAAFGRQLRFVARRDRVRAPVWIGSIVGLAAFSAYSVDSLYQTQTDLQGYADLALANLAFKAIAGPGYGLDDVTLGAVVMNEVSMYTYIAVALMAIFMVTRHTRAEEESERSDLVRAAPVGRYTALATASVWVSAIVLVIGIGLTAGMLAIGLATAGSVAFGAATVAIGLVFVGVAAVSAQVATSARAANAIGGAVLGLSFVVRAVGDVGNGWMTWLSPVGITQAIRPYADERWWVLAPLAVITVSTMAAAVVMLGRRDLGAGSLSQRSGPATGSPRLATPLAIAVRLQRASFVGWFVGVALTAYFVGLIADEAEAIAENEAVAEFLTASAQGTLTELLLATMALMIALIASGFTVASVLRLRTEELAVRADPILATPVGRRRWLVSHFAVSVGGSLLIMLGAGVAMGLGYLSSTSKADEILPVIGASLAQFVPMVVLASFSLALFALTPRWALFAWLGVVVSWVVGMLGNTLDLPQWLRNLSPFEHVPALPAAPFDAVPLLILCAVAAVSTAVAMFAIRRRDIS